MARRSDHTRDEIRNMALDAAERIVAAEGYKGLSARKVAAAIDYTVGTLYLVFENLDDLVLQVNGRTLDALFDWLQPKVSPRDTAQSALHTLAAAYIAYTETESPRWNMLFEFVADKGNALPEWYMAKLAKVFGLVEAALGSVARGRSEEEIRQAARVLWAGVHGICIVKVRQHIELAGGQTAQAMAEMLIDSFLRGFNAPAA